MFAALTEIIARFEAPPGTKRVYVYQVAHVRLCGLNAVNMDRKQIENEEVWRFVLAGVSCTFACAGKSIIDFVVRYQ